MFKNVASAKRCHLITRHLKPKFTERILWDPRWHQHHPSTYFDVRAGEYLNVIDLLSYSCSHLLFQNADAECLRESRRKRSGFTKSWRRWLRGRAEMGRSYLGSMKIHVGDIELLGSCEAGGKTMITCVTISYEIALHTSTVDLLHQIIDLLLVFLPNSICTFDLRYFVANNLCTALLLVFLPSSIWYLWFATLRC